VAAQPIFRTGHRKHNIIQPDDFAKHNGPCDYDIRQQFSADGI
jgi:hypothetical protein